MIYLWKIRVLSFWENVDRTFHTQWVDTEHEVKAPTYADAKAMAMDLAPKAAVKKMREEQQCHGHIHHSECEGGECVQEVAS